MSVGEKPKPTPKPETITDKIKYRARLDDKNFVIQKLDELAAKHAEAKTYIDHPRRPGAPHIITAIQIPSLEYAIKITVIRLQETVEGKSLKAVYQEHDPDDPILTIGDVVKIVPIISPGVKKS